MDQRTITLADDDAELATQLVAEGRFSSAEAVVHAAMDTLRETVDRDLTQDWETVRAAAAEGEAALARGEYVQLDTDADLEAHLDTLLAKVEGGAARRP